MTDFNVGLKYQNIALLGVILMARVNLCPRHTITIIFYAEVEELEQIALRENNLRSTILNISEARDHLFVHCYLRFYVR